jgi:predicted NBD/HSP70 family sugar kinase
MSYMYTKQRDRYTIQDLKKDLLTNRAHPKEGHTRGLGGEPNSIQEQIRDLNRQFILNFIRKYAKEKIVTRSSIAQSTGLSRTTVGKIIEDLIEDGWIYEGEQMDATRRGGHRATSIHFNADAGIVIGIEIGLTHFAVLITNLEGRVAYYGTHELRTDLGAEVCLNLLVEWLQKFMKEKHLAWNKVIGLGVGIPGTLDPELKMLTDPPLMQHWGGTDIPHYLRRRLKVPVYLDNDANMGALGESTYGEGQGAANLIYIKIGTGLGAGVIVDGRILRGSRGAAGEFGHVKVVGGSLPGKSYYRSENCCNYHCAPGCLESIAGEKTIVEAAHQGISLFDVLTLSEYHHASDGSSIETIEDVARAAQRENEASRNAIRQAGELIGVALGGFINIFNPEKVVLDGGVVRAAGQLILDPIREKAMASCLPAMKDPVTGTVPIVPSKFLYEDKSAIAYGAAARVIEAIDNAFMETRGMRLVGQEL